MGTELGWGDTMGSRSQENASLVRRFLTDIVAGGDTDAVEAFITDDLVDHHLVFGDTSEREPVTMAGWRALAAADIDVTVEDVVATEDKVAVRATVTGTYRESLVDLASTGASFEIAYVWFCRIEDGQITEIWSLPDGLGLMQQLDTIPPQS